MVTSKAIVALYQDKIGSTKVDDTDLRNLLDIVVRVRNNGVLLEVLKAEMSQGNFRDLTKDLAHLEQTTTLGIRLLVKRRQTDSPLF